MNNLSQDQLKLRLTTFFSSFKKDFGTDIEPAIVTELVKQELSNKIKERVKNSLWP